uniref:Uncharacterized protein n=1 Tax=Solanum tuberosum TaxID=4113 RepID=M1DG13_SOLTU
MNAHKKTQPTHARVNCALKDLSCYSPLSKFLNFTILASNASSSSTKLTQDRKGLFKACNGAECKGGVRAGTESAGVEAEETLAESRRDLAQISVRRYCRGRSSSGLDNVAWESTDSLSLSEFRSRTSNAGLLPLPIPHVGGSVIPFLERFVPLPLITISRALLRGGMSIFVLPIFEKHQKKLEVIKAKEHKNTVADRHTEPVGKSSNHFGEPDWDRRKDWLKI